MRNAQSQGQRKKRAAIAGFSLVELLIVVAVILIIAAMAIPAFIKSKERANESSAAQALRTISTAEIVYSTTYNIGYSTSMAHLSGNQLTADVNNAGLIDTVLASGVKGGYTYNYTVMSSDSQGNVTSYAANADPIVQNVSGQLHFYTDQTGVIRANSTVAAGPNDTPLL
jgi:type IV pilus assembly protein PilA